MSKAESSLRSSAELFRDSSSTEADPLVENIEFPTRKPSSVSRRFRVFYGRSHLILWFLAGALLGCLSLYTTGVLRRHARPCSCPSTAQRDTYTYWRDGEFLPATKELPAKLKRVHFNATLKYNENGKLYRPVTDPPFVGDPSPEIDAAWAQVAGAGSVFVTPEEQRQLGVDLYLDPKSGLYMADISVFHDLHCVNYLRKSLNPEYYTELKNTVVKEHIEHCLDSLRLSIMCTGDMTMMPIRWSKNSKWIIPKFDIDHTCRDYDALRTWSLNRDAADEGLWQKNAARLQATGH